MQTLEPIRIFVTVAEMGSFTRAADSLGIQKGRASTAVRKLEEDIGVRLLHRTTRSVQLTEDGRAFHVRARDLLAGLHAELRPCLPHLESLWTHNDLHCSNLLWSDTSARAHPAAILDFGLADRTNAVHDLAHAIERNMVEWLALVQHPDRPEDVPLHLDHLQALLDGYESVRPLSAHEAAALAPMTALCHAEFALSEADYFLGSLHSEDKARMAYDGWLVGHAAWFHSARGTSLLDVIRRRAAHRAGRPARAVPA